VIDADGSSEDLARRRGCLATLLGIATLIVVAPPALAIRHWRKMRRGGEVRSSLDFGPFKTSEGEVRRRLDVTIDVPQKAEPEVRRRITDAIVRVAEGLRQPGDVYHLIYRLPWDEDPAMRPVGPQLQEFGDRVSLVLTQGAMAGRTAVWLTLDRATALSDVVDPLTYDPEAEGEPEALLAHSGARWAMATSWARVGPSLVVRLILIVPSESIEGVTRLLEPLQRDSLASSG
jgi:hypothetical protein